MVSQDCSTTLYESHKTMVLQIQQNFAARGWKHSHECYTTVVKQSRDSLKMLSRIFWRKNLHKIFMFKTFTTSLRHMKILVTHECHVKVP